MRLDDEVIVLINLYKKCEALCARERLAAGTLDTIFQNEAEVLVAADKMSKEAVEIVTKIYKPKVKTSPPIYYNERRNGGC